MFSSLDCSGLGTIVWAGSDRDDCDDYSTTPAARVPVGKPADLGARAGDAIQSRPELIWGSAMNALPFSTDPLKMVSRSASADSSEHQGILHGVLLHRPSRRHAILGQV